MNGFDMDSWKSNAADFAQDARSRAEGLINSIKLTDLLERKREEDKMKKTIITVLAVLGIVAAVAAIAYAVYRFVAPDYLEDYEDYEGDSGEDAEDADEDVVEEN